ncbi:MAG: amidohydrolase family protein [Acidimicrobiales bacterium]
MKDRAVFDAHTHAVSPDLDRFPRTAPSFPAAWLDDDPPSANALEAALDAAGVAGAALVQPQGAYRFDNRYVLEAAAESPHLAPVVSIDMTDPQRAAVLAESATAGAVGVRLFSIPTPEQSWLADPATFDVWELCRARSLVVSICCLPAELEAVARVVRTFRDLPVVLDHCGFVDVVDGAGPLEPLVPLENLHLKVTGHMLHEAEQHGAVVSSVVETLAAMVGPSRLIWGSDWPQTGLSYTESVSMARRATTTLTAADAERVLGATAAQLYRRPLG